jgi:Uma2 family endonuclease
MQPLATTRMTADEFWDFCLLPENEGREIELIRGEVVEVSRPRRPHGRVCINFGFALESYARATGRGYVVSNDSGVMLGEEQDTVLGPDVAYFVGATTFEELPEKWGTDVPVLAVEVRSVNDRSGEVGEKVAEYLRGGVSLVWVADYEAQTVTVHRTGAEPTEVGPGEVLTGGEHLPGFAAPVADLFRMPGRAQ